MAAWNARMLAQRYAVSNERDVASYHQLHKQWSDRAPLLAASTPPMEPEKEPSVPGIYFIDQALAALIFDAWDSAVQDRQLPGDSVPDYTPAITKTKYKPPVVAGPVVLPQPAKPLGVKIGKGKFGEAPGDKYPVGHVWTDPETDVEWLKVAEDSIAGENTLRYWRVAT
jgi:hypothetical protein